MNKLIYSEFMEVGHIIFGLNRIQGEKDAPQCGCGWEECQAIGKHPVASNWQFSPHWSEDQIEVMEQTGQLATGYGVLVTGLIVVDIDARNGGVASYEKLLADIPEIAGAGLIVETGSGGGSKHLYFKAPNPAIALVQSHKKYKGIDFKSSGFVVGPGSLHASGNTYKAVYGSPDEIDDAPQALIDLLEKPEFHRADFNGEPVDVSEADISKMLSHIDPDCEHEEWVRAGMAVHHATQGTGFAVWDEWSNSGTKYPGTEKLEKRWHSFGKSANPVTLGTLAHYASQGGWLAPVTFKSDMEFTQETAPPPTGGLPFDISGVDLLRPPGFVGTLTGWINDQCRYPREHLAVAAAITSIGNIAGLRHIDARDGVTANLFTFCVAASGTGKEAIGQAVTDILGAAGVSEAAHGGIKSEQEIVRNMLRNQGAFYTVDEVGYLLQKIKNAQGGGASYLEGVIGVLMSSYSKANGTMPLGGDLKEQVRGEILKELGQATRKVDENDDKSGKFKRRIPQLELQLDHISKGLHRPFISLIGYTTPENFSGLVDGEAARSGFIGRSLIFQERKDNPRSKRRFKKRVMPEHLAATLSGLYVGGDYDITDSRVEQRGELINIPTSPEADDMLENALTWIESYADMHMEKTGMTAVVRRGYEIMAKVSLILAIPSGLRTSEHVRWAFAMMHRDIDDKISLTLENEDTGETQLMRKILNLVTTDDGCTLGVLRNKLRKYAQDDIDKALDLMESKKLMKRMEIEYKHGGKKRVEWFRAKE